MAWEQNENTGKWTFKGRREITGGPEPKPVMAPSNRTSIGINPSVQPMTNVLKALLPRMSPQDYQVISRYYGVKTGKKLNPNEKNPLDMTGELRNYYFSRSRAAGTLKSLRKQTTGQQVGPGYRFLANVLKLMKSLGAKGPTQGMSSANYAKFTTQLNNLLLTAQTDQGLTDPQFEQYANLAQMFTNPSLRSGPLMSKTSTGYGPAQNKKLFT